MRNIPDVYDAFDAFFSNNDRMRTDVREKDNHYILDIELAGYNKEDISLKVKNGYLIVTATHQQSDQMGELLRNERFFGSCSRSYYFGNNLTGEDVNAKYENGILSVSILKEKPVENTTSIINID